VRATTAFKHLLRLPGVTVSNVAFGQLKVVVTVRLRRRVLACPECAYTTRSRYGARPVASRWRHLDLGSGASRS
jgi:transposase